MVLSLALVVCAAGCAKHEDTSTASGTASDAAASTVTASAAPSTAADAATTAPDTSASAAADAAPSSAATNATTTVNGTTVSTGSDIKNLNAPVYPGAKVRNDGDLEATSDGIHQSIVTLTSTDSFDTVDAWYKTHTDGYKPSHMSLMGLEESTYSSGDTDALPFKNIVLTTHKDDKGGPETMILVTVKEKAP